MVIGINKLTQKGFSLIELSIVLLILGLLVAGVIGASIMSTNEVKRYNAVQGLDRLGISAAKFKLDGSYGSNGLEFTQLLIQSKLVPSIFSVVEGKILHNLSPTGTITLRGHGSLFKMTITDITIADCIYILAASADLYVRAYFKAGGASDLLVQSSFNNETPFTSEKIGTICRNGMNLILISN